MPTLWACVWTFTDLKKTYPGLRTKNLKYRKFLALLPHFSMEYNIAHLVWKALGRCAAEGFISKNTGSKHGDTDLANFSNNTTLSHHEAVTLLLHLATPGKILD